MSVFRSAALAILVTASSVGSVCAAPNVLTGGANSTLRAHSYSSSYLQTYTPRPCLSREVLDNTRHAFYDSCTGAFIRVDVR